VSAALCGKVDPLLISSLAVTERGPVTFGVRRLVAAFVQCSCRHMAGDSFPVAYRRGCSCARIKYSRPARRKRPAPTLAIQMSFKTVIFDFDYTLADSSRGIIECIDYALGTMELAGVSDDAACRTIGMSLPDVFKALTAIDDSKAAGEFSRLFISKADEVMVDATELFDSAHGVIRGLKEREVRVGIVSTKYRHRIEAVLARDGLLDPIDVIIGGEDVARHKPDPEGLLMALDRLQCSSSNALYVGDSIVDAIVAQRAGTPFVAVLSGTTTKDAFDQYGPLEVMDTLGDLPQVISRLGAQAGRGQQ